MRGIRCALAAVLAAGIVTVVAAQPGRQMGGGFGALDVTSLVLTNTALQDELKLTDSQKEKLKPALAKQNELNKKRGEMFGKGGNKGNKGGFDKEKFTEMMEEGKKVTEEVHATINDTLTAEQKTRVKQISIQVLGVSVFAEPTEGKGGGGFGGTSDAQKALMKEVATTLKLTDDQKSKIKNAVSEYTKDRDAVRKDIFGDAKGKAAFDQEKQKEFATKSTKLSTEAMEKIAEALDDTQKTAWKGLVGESFDTSKLRAPAPKKD